MKLRIGSVSVWSLFLLKERGIYLFLIKLIKNEIFTDKSACALIDDIWHPASKNFGTLLWQSILPPKIKMFLWWLLQGSLSVKEIKN